MHLCNEWGRLCYYCSLYGLVIFMKLYVADTRNGTSGRILSIPVLLMGVILEKAKTMQANKNDGIKRLIAMDIFSAFQKGRSGTKQGYVVLYCTLHFHT